MELFKKVSILSALLLAAASTTSAFIPRTNTGRVGGLCMSAVEETVAKKEGTVISSIRNIAVIAHVDHGKTTLVDALIRQSGVFRDDAQANDAGIRVMDSEDQERERGITILSKNLAVQRDGVKINIMDTPGHADFGGEVERVLNMCDGVLLLVDSVEGPKPQTRFVLDKALQKGMKALVVVNKVDRPAARVEYVVDNVFDLFVDLGATDEQTDFRVVYASGLLGTAGDTPDGLADDMGPLFDAILESIDPPMVENTAADGLQCLISNIIFDPFKGKMGIARISNGSIKKGQAVALAHPDKETRKGRVGELFVFDNLGKKEVDDAAAGEIIMFSGLEGVEIGDTLITNENAGANAAPPMEPIAIEQPTVRMTIGVNKSPLAGREGKFLTSRMIRDRLFKELDRNVALQVKETDSADKYEVSGRGQLHLTVLIETMRREGFELQVGPPTVIIKTNEETGKLEEPWESVEVRVPQEYSGAVVELLNLRKGVLQDMGLEESMSVVKYLVPTRGMLGIRSALLSSTRGTAIIDSVFDSYRPKIAVEIQARDKGSLLAFAEGPASTFGIEGAQTRGQMFVSVNDDVYKGMIIGIHQRPGDLEVNICKTKALNNMRAAGKDNNAGVIAPVEMSLDSCVEYIASDEILEITPSLFRMSKNPDFAKKGKGGRGN
ncbi:GTP-binding protein typA [Fragilariopsis cylindrus CCMP1102]|uniref:GTP-binding protein typA n=1 Tax=Fragilariopsis cylindrus CCMP1102 TaxID=635003 RepID=A0A1E7FD36_9STRA|nr:GTP-binding protein typA [Fragilariopsis cylindrus CCMP1102]|eukprot:OEU16044.1 GTP-binding protein typA [Fragilariopsis cylindrus CCMP1102]